MSTTGAPVGVAVVGYGYWGVNLARNAAVARGMRLVGIADPDAARRAVAAEDHPEVPCRASLAEVLADPDVEAVVLAVPASDHVPAARAALAAGRHVLVEKPFALDVAGAEAVVADGVAADRVVMAGHTFLYSPPVVYLRELMAAGGLGPVRYLASRRLALGRVRRDCSALWNFGPHDVSIFVDLLGELPHEVSATSFAVLDPALPDVWFASLRFPSGVAAHLHVSWIDPAKVRQLTVVGAERMAVYDDVSVDRKITVYDAGVDRDEGFGDYRSFGDFQWRTRAGDISVPHIELTEPLRLELEAFAEACRGGAAPRTGPEHAVAVTRILAAAESSAAAGGAPVELVW